MIDKTTLWTAIIGIGLGTYLLRISFLGMIGNRPLPPFVLRLLRYTPMAVIPGLVAPAVVWPTATGGQPDLVQILAAVATVVAGIVTRNTLMALAVGAGVLGAGMWLF